MPNHKAPSHTPVLLREVIDELRPQAGQSYLDLTAGYGGHAAVVLEATGSPEQAVLVDRDDGAVEALKKRFGAGGPTIIHSDFLSTLEKLAGEGRQFDMILADLGVSSPHLDASERGFSFNSPGPLDMRMDRRQELSADYIVNQLPAAELAGILERFGEEPKAKQVAQAIVASRPVKDTEHLAAIIDSVTGHPSWRAKKIHPATRSFQAIRIAVNDELAQLERGLPLMLALLKPGGRLVVISFHSLEDRIVKRFFAERSGPTYDAELTMLTKRPVTADRNEIVSNPRARSAKLRAASKIKTNRKDK